MDQNILSDFRNARTPSQEAAFAAQAERGCVEYPALLMSQGKIIPRHRAGTASARAKRRSRVPDPASTTSAPSPRRASFGSRETTSAPSPRRAPFGSCEARLNSGTSQPPASRPAKNVRPPLDARRGGRKKSRGTNTDASAFFDELASAMREVLLEELSDRGCSRCSICMGDGSGGWRAMVPCGHEYCEDCMVWERCATCPACRQPIEQALRVYR